MKAEVQVVYPNLHFYIHGERVLVRGTFPIIHEGEELDRYALEIILPADYPDRLPLVLEVGGRVPRDADHHVNGETGEACLFVPDERWRICPPGMSLLEFLNGPVKNFFVGQSLFRLTGEWPFGQRPHGAAGIREYYSELLGTDDSTVILAYLECLSRTVLKGHVPCPCGARRRLRNCHRAEIEALRAKIPPPVALRSWEKLRKVVSASRTQLA
jgi:hypothetical protein